MLKFSGGGVGSSRGRYFASTKASFLGKLSKKWAGVWENGSDGQFLSKLLGQLNPVKWKERSEQDKPEGVGDSNEFMGCPVYGDKKDMLRKHFDYHLIITKLLGEDYQVIIPLNVKFNAWNNWTRKKGGLETFFVNKFSATRIGGRGEGFICEWFLNVMMNVSASDPGWYDAEVFVSCKMREDVETNFALHLEVHVLNTEGNSFRVGGKGVLKVIENNSPLRFAIPRLLRCEELADERNKLVDYNSDCRLKIKLYCVTGFDVDPALEIANLMTGGDRIAVLMPVRGADSGLESMTLVTQDVKLVLAKDRLSRPTWNRLVHIFEKNLEMGENLVDATVDLRKFTPGVVLKSLGFLIDESKVVKIGGLHECREIMQMADYLKLASLKALCTLNIMERWLGVDTFGEITAILYVYNMNDYISAKLRHYLYGNMEAISKSMNLQRWVKHFPQAFIAVLLPVATDE